MQAPALEIPRQTEDAFIRPFWGRALGAPWCASVLVLVLLTCARAYAMLGPPSARPLFLLQFLAMWTLPFVLLTPAGRREIGLRKSGNTVAAFFWSALAGAACALGAFALGLRSEEHTSELQSRGHLVCRLLLEKKKKFYVVTHIVRV